MGPWDGCLGLGSLAPGGVIHILGPFGFGLRIYRDSGGHMHTSIQISNRSRLREPSGLSML